MQAADALREIRAGKAGTRVRYFQSNNATGLLMEYRQRTNGHGKLTMEAADADDIAIVTSGLSNLGLGRLTQERLSEPGDFSFNYYITLVREISLADIARARTAYQRPVLVD